ncbi:MAG: hypothetical protein P1U56_18270 [Saprospiraceae bacterium]|nr:hypothetical protein [Saprospiraceae bacterium]
MKRAILIIHLVLFIFCTSYATQQQPDILLTHRDTLYIDVGWGHPSPLQTYFSQNKIKYPFKSLHSANYRGHVATWSIENKMLYIQTIQVNEINHSPNEFMLQKTTNENQNIQANWFTGYLLARKYSPTNYYEIEFETYYYVKNGEIVKEVTFTNQDYEKVKINIDAGINPKTNERLSILQDYEKYISYYFRLHDDEAIQINDQDGFITRAVGGKLVLQYYNDDHFSWPYNWEAEDISGVPVGTWLIEEDQIFLTEIELHTGLGFYETETYDIELSNVFEGKESKIKAKWLNGLYLIQHRKEMEKEDDDDVEDDFEDDDELSIYDYEVVSFRILDVKDGIVVNQCTAPGDLYYYEINETTPDNTKRLINLFFSQRQ